MLQITDFKNAFCQSHRLNRPLGPILVQPCKGLPLKSGELIQLLRPVHGLDGAPIVWHETITTEFVSGLGHRRSLLEPCWFVKHDDDTHLLGQFLFGTLTTSRLEPCLKSSPDLRNT